jgi:ABC-2 type transport system permease protein
MAAIFRREMHAYFTTPLGYVFLAAVFFFNGYFFYTYNLIGATTDTSQLFGQLFTVVLFVSPLLTMRLLPEDRHLNIDRQLFSAPVSRGAIAAGKYLSAVLVYSAAITSVFSGAAIMSAYGRPDWPVIFGNYAGLLLAGCALISICLFLSSFTESQFIAALAGFFVSLMLTMLDAASLLMGGGRLQQAMLAVSFSNRYSPFAMGVFDIGGAAYFIGVAAFFVALTAAVLERRVTA